jgi:hypothetical protein
LYIVAAIDEAKRQFEKSQQQCFLLRRLSYGAMAYILAAG